MTEQSENISRVRAAIAAHIVQFIDERINTEFYVDELRRYVAGKVPVAPASPDRILRLLRQAGTINYVVTNRAKSKYKALPVGGRLF